MLDDTVSAACVRRSPLRQQLGRHNTRRVAARRPRRALRHRRCRALHMVQVRRCTARRAAAAAAAAAIAAAAAAIAAAAAAAIAVTVAAIAAAATRQPRTCGIAARRDSRAAHAVRRAWRSERAQPRRVPLAGSCCTRRARRRRGDGRGGGARRTAHLALLHPLGQ